ncbi:hypothetical protein ACFL0Z_02395 [Patescibacteria group bacterium]
MSKKLGLREGLHLLHQLSDAQIRAQVRHLGPVKKFLNELMQQDKENYYFEWISDDEAVGSIVKHKLGSCEDARTHVARCRALASYHNYHGKIFVIVKAGFTPKAHASKLGPSCEKFGYLQKGELENVDPTVESLVFFVPRLVAGSMGRNAEEQLQLLANFAEAHWLPDHYLTSFGGVALLLGLIESHFHCTGERVPLNYNWSRTDTGHLLVGHFDKYGPFCGSWDRCDDHSRRKDLGCFMLGINEIPGN